jgi:hypothetical protein
MVRQTKNIQSAAALQAKTKACWLMREVEGEWQ